MTNSQIILLESIKLMEAGVIGSTGNYIEIETDDGEKKKLLEPEPIHTFAKWKEFGYVVKRGEHAVASFPIWKMIKSKKSEDADADGSDDSKMFLKKSFWFTFSQVEKIKEKEVV